MRKNLGVVFDAWRHRRPCHLTGSCWTDGTTLYSYNTAILTRAGDGQVILNGTTYSKTTSEQQNALRAVLETFKEVTGCPWDSTPHELVARA